MTRWFPHRSLAKLCGYELEKRNKEISLASHLHAYFDMRSIDLVLDVGANSGQYAHLLRKELNYQGEIISFEPDPEVFTGLAEIAQQDDRWRVVNCALGNADTEVSLYQSNRSVFNSLHQHSDLADARFAMKSKVIGCQLVEQRRLDTLLPELVPDFYARNVFLKMDTQGHDFWVFEGAGDYRSSFTGLQSEVSVVGIYEGVPNYIEMFEVYRTHGFELTGMYVVNRVAAGSFVIEMDVVFASVPD